MAASLRLLSAIALAASAASAALSHRSEGYTPAAADTARVAVASRGAEGERATALPIGAAITGFLSARGLPPRSGRFVVTDTGLVFLSADGQVARTYPLIGPVRERNGRRSRTTAVSLAYADSTPGRRFYLFRLDGGVFGTEEPGPLLDVAARPYWLDSLASREWRRDRPLVNPRDQAAIWLVVRSIERSAYADTLYALFGRPARPAGLVDGRGRRAGRLGEYIASRDSLALDPGRMTGQEQLRHAMAHELAHRWQARSPGQLRTLWHGIGRMRDSRRYGHDKVSEHQAEALAFAVHFLQASAAANDAEAAAGLEQYEHLVPGTGAMVRYLALQPIYARHPLRRVLTTGHPSS
ncbi:MAG TPA: hypothetical protein VG500_02860 [Gemmatimonadales bacterium]|nr:hypothetical protein [Gemmatimonadales bacterium]